MGLNSLLSTLPNGGASSRPKKTGEKCGPVSIVIGSNLGSINNPYTSPTSASESRSPQIWRDSDKVRLGRFQIFSIDPRQFVSV